MRPVAAIALCFAAALVTSAAVGLAQAQPEEEVATQQVVACIESNAMRECMSGVLPKMVATFGLERSNRLILEAVSRTGVDGIIACHFATEDLGRLWATQQGVAALDNLVYSCLGGPMHGVFYTLGATLPGTEMASRSRGICEEFAKGKPWIAGWDCRHGVGHAVGLDADLSAEEAFSLCEKVYDTPTHQEDCASGTMGSIVDRAALGGEVRSFNLTDPLAWCRDTVAESMVRACTTRAPSVLHASGKPLREIVDYCRDRDTDCAYGVGYVAGIPGERWPAHFRVGVCRSFTEDKATACMAGLIRSITPDYRLLDVDPGICAVAGDLFEVCLEETKRMRERELTLGQVLDLTAPAYRGDRDPAPWPRS